MPTLDTYSPIPQTWHIVATAHPQWTTPRVASRVAAMHDVTVTDVYEALMDEAKERAERQSQCGHGSIDGNARCISCGYWCG